jgi:hypothetical protein
MHLVEIFSIVAFLLTFAGFCFGLIKYINKQDGEVIKAADEKIGKVYSRFDVHKKFLEDNFVRKDMCGVMHQANAENLIGVERRLGEKMKDIEKKVDENFRVVIDLMKTK